MQFYFRLDSNRIRAVFGLVYLGLALPFDIKNAQHLSVVFSAFFPSLCFAFSFVLLLYFLVINSLWPKAKILSFLALYIVSSYETCRLDLALFICLLVNSCCPLSLSHSPFTLSLSLCCTHIKRRIFCVLESTFRK